MQTWQRVGEAVAQVDVLTNFAVCAQSLGWVRPEFVRLPGIEIRNARHPVVESTIEQYVQVTPFEGNSLTNDSRPQQTAQIAAQQPSSI